MKDKFPETYAKSVILKDNNEISNKEFYIMEAEGYNLYYTSGRTKWIKTYKE